ncbi:hypothetical protein M431DRAFT_470206 [Trichoderma harzianum CBS 226.95]|uniref:Uncharacterized protein n=1 Tax=Trichoderma harzianum CBS 226.95 TaxID=983964 RepID=A0A2T4A6L6_TRIHA|nr:hypothetical protein M431DRAFT_470206 [Trichoderma harzianum CBS 226.95]PTB52724.1 hypothetical protein M431DRAFT_470206 [Trichoderma harzianum CBS 226.95]
MLLHQPASRHYRDFAFFLFFPFSILAPPVIAPYERVRKAGDRVVTSPAADNARKPQRTAHLADGQPPT